MNASMQKWPGTVVSALLFAAPLMLAGCAATPTSPDGADQVRAKLTQLQSDPALAGRVPVALEEAEAAVALAEQPVPRDEALGRHRVYMADRKVEIARARARTDFAEEERDRLSEARERVRLDARTLEADRAQRETAVARTDAAQARMAAEEAARRAELQAEEFRRQVEELEAEATDRGLVLTLGDVLFATGQAELQSGATVHLDRLASFLHQYPERRVEIEGHTDNVGSEALNQALSERRAESVKSYLVGQGIDRQRISAIGKGLHYPIADNSTAAGRQQNRRVEVIILD
jgi:outer membrane protein OmpA-like peptidoglycan-associated protein